MAAIVEVFVIGASVDGKTVHYFPRVKKFSTQVIHSLMFRQC